MPETFWGLRMSAACFVHDYMWVKAERTWEAFHHSNSIFLHNLLAIIDSAGGFVRYFRCYRAVTYYMFVDSAFKIFWRNK